MVTLLLTMLLLELGVLAADFPVGCVVVGVLAHFFLLSASTWIAISSLHAYRVFRRAIVSSPEGFENGSHTFIRYVAVALVLPAVVVAVTLLGNLLASRSDCVHDLGYGKGACFLSSRWSVILSAILPISVVVLLILVLYLLAVRALAKTTRERQKTSHQHRRRFVVHVRISALMAVTWLTGMSAVLVDPEILWYVFVVLCGLLGVHVFVEFVCNQRVLKLYRNRFSPCCQRERRYKKDQRFSPIDT